MSMFTAKAVVTRDADSIHIDVHWNAPVDRKCTGGWAVSLKHEKLAQRLVAAINAQKGLSNPKIATDVNGKTYIAYTQEVSGRHMNADLRRLGF